jgi:uncharacterized protein YicC (UPF0701 family)
MTMNTKLATDAEQELEQQLGDAMEADLARVEEAVDKVGQMAAHDAPKQLSLIDINVRTISAVMATLQQRRDQVSNKIGELQNHLSEIDASIDAFGAAKERLGKGSPEAPTKAKGL